MFFSSLFIIDFGFASTITNGCGIFGKLIRKPSQPAIVDSLSLEELRFQIPRPPAALKKWALNDPNIKLVSEQFKEGEGLVFFLENLQQNGRLIGSKKGEGKASLQTELELKEIFPKAIFRYGAEKATENISFLEATPHLKKIAMKFTDAAEDTGERKIVRQVHEMKFDPHLNKNQLTLEMAFRKMARTKSFENSEQLMQAFGINSSDFCSHYYLFFFRLTGDSGDRFDRYFETHQKGPYFEDLLAKTILRPGYPLQDFVFVSTNREWDNYSRELYIKSKAPELVKNFSKVVLLSTLNEGALGKLHVKGSKPILIINDVAGAKSPIDAAISNAHSSTIVAGPLNGFESRIEGVPTVWLNDKELTEKFSHPKIMIRYEELASQMGIGFTQNIDELGQKIDQVQVQKKSKEEIISETSWHTWVAHLGYWLREAINP